jgi:hypothetical protein
MLCIIIPVKQYTTPEAPLFPVSEATASLMAPNGDAGKNSQNRLALCPMFEGVMQHVDNRG